MFYLLVYDVSSRQKEMFKLSREYLNPQVCFGPCHCVNFYTLQWSYISRFRRSTELFLTREIIWFPLFLQLVPIYISLRSFFFFVCKFLPFPPNKIFPPQQKILSVHVLLKQKYYSVQTMWWIDLIFK